MLVLPAPDGPASARHSPGLTLSATSRASAPSRVCASTRSTAECLAALDELDGEQDRRGDGHEHGREGERRLEVGGEAVVDRQRNGLGDSLERAGEHERRAELAE